MIVAKDIQVLKTNEFNKIIIDFIFPVKREKNFSLYGNLLVRLLTQKTNVYPKEEDFSKALIKNNCMDFSFSKSECGENWFYTYHIVLPDNKVLKDPEYDFKTTIFFLLNSIYEPYGLGTSFYEEEFLHAKEKLKIFIEQNLANSNYYAQLELEKQ